MTLQEGRGMRFGIGVVGISWIDIYSKYGEGSYGVKVNYAKFQDVLAKIK